MNSEMAPSAQIPASIEVERKFVPGPDVEKKLCTLGAVLLEELTFRDSYYDSPDLLLTLNDNWLRRREDSWELKHPPQKGARGLKGAATQYMELTSEDDIICRVSEELGVPCPINIESFGLNEFASFVTRRRRFLLPLAEHSNTKVVVDLDEADFGFAVGEVEVLVKTQEEIESAFQKVEEICRQLGVFRETPVQGKVSTFLQMNCADHFRKLVEAHVI
ncbi:thiamine-triphosphatase isoform X2 [Engystomops pustulosus]|uniref:thiamine-triphosphatase isoform X2 n=2 Tax=Engystomops pustulosus TaxID=76066 RepID=UPI003AFB3FFF